MPQRILVVDDEPAVLAFVGRMLQAGGYEVVRASDAEQALAFAAVPPSLDLVLSDVVLPGMRGPELIEALRRTSPQTAMMLMSGYANTDLPQDIPFLAKPFRASELLPKVREVLGRSAPVPSEQPIDEPVQSFRIPLQTHKLSPREVEVLRLMCDGLSTPRIAAELGLAVKTVMTHRYRILKKTDTHDTVMAMRWAIRAGILEP